jgi:hypothetical protein
MRARGLAGGRGLPGPPARTPLPVAARAVLRAGPAAVSCGPPTLEGDRRTTVLGGVAVPSASCRAPGAEAPRALLRPRDLDPQTPRRGRSHSTRSPLDRHPPGLPGGPSASGAPEPVPLRLLPSVPRRRFPWSRSRLLRPHPGRPAIGRAHLLRPGPRGLPRGSDPPESPPGSTTVPGGVGDFYSRPRGRARGSAKILGRAKPVEPQRLSRPSTTCGRACGERVKNWSRAVDSVCTQTHQPVYNVWITAHRDHPTPDGDTERIMVRAAPAACGTSTRHRRANGGPGRGDRRLG